jgi:hypothetical protein
MEEEFIENVIKTYRSQGIVTELIPRGAVKHLRGCLWCMDLEGIKHIDSVTISSQRGSRELDSDPVYNFEYALRGTINEVPTGRLIVKTESSWKGFIRRELKTVSWAVPESSDISGFKRYGESPKPGELYEGGPNKLLVDLLNTDISLLEDLQCFLEGLGDLTSLVVYSDRWGESLRLAIGTWFNEDKSREVFISPSYIDISSSVFGYVQEVRQRLGGITF